MYVEKIEIPAFRVLRDVVLEFGGGYDPQIFPIGSENGGGKSTLLQLVFALLHCSAEPRRHEYLSNLLASDSYTGVESERLIARLTVRDGREAHAIDFVSLGSQFLVGKLDNPPPRGFDVWDEARGFFESQRTIQERLDQLVRKREIRHDGVDDIEIANLQQQQDFLRPLQLQFLAQRERIKEFLLLLDHVHVTNYRRPSPSGGESRALIYRVPGRSAVEAKELLRVAASKVFLLGPSNQQYLFLGMDARKALLAAVPANAQSSKIDTPSKPRPQIEYMTKLDEAERTMPGFFAYDWLSVEPLVQLFALARDEDFKGAVKTGSYGDRYTTMLKEVNGLLLGKQVRPLEDLSGVEFVVTGPDGRETKLSPEDLSQGELKRLMIYAWLKANKAVDSLVLIDEIEASLHPDWQLGIVHDLQEWAPKNQYLLATHSYDLCQALTPRHVRELQPRLQWRGAPAAEGATEPQDRSDE